MVEPLRIEHVNEIGLATLMARKNVSAEQIGRALGIEAPDGLRWTTAAGAALMGVGPRTWMIQRDRPSPFWTEELRQTLDGIASVSDQSSAYRVWRISGLVARTILQRGAAIDFHPDSFSTGSVATTVIAHIGVIIRQLDDQPAYEVATFRSYTNSFRHWLDQAAAAL